MEWKKIRRKCMYPNVDKEPKMHTLYECLGKVGTTATDIIWFLDKPEKGKFCYGINENSHYSPYMEGHAFQYATFDRMFIDDIYPNGYVLVTCY